MQHSGYFRRLLSSSLPLSETSITLEGVPKAIFVVFLDVLYTNSIAPRKCWRHAYPDITARERGAAGSFYIQLYMFAQEYEVPRMSELVRENVKNRYFPDSKTGPILPETATICRDPRPFFNAMSTQCQEEILCCDSITT